MKRTTFYLIAVIVLWVAELYVLKTWFGVDWAFIKAAIIMTAVFIFLFTAKAYREHRL